MQLYGAVELEDWLRILAEESAEVIYAFSNPKQYSQETSSLPKNALYELDDTYYQITEGHYG